MAKMGKPVYAGDRAARDGSAACKP